MDFLDLPESCILIFYLYHIQHPDHNNRITGAILLLLWWKKQLYAKMRAEA